ncbi:hypothetical protein [uncultured Campylobacter sp.]|uniref:hypothetical protein n=1 Tax=uncultured Campylobacter sp. TaxID=218934 RepID=UPI002610C4A1|nr:hypothetical protein [uncultured Campylobacter sp.]
MRCKKGLLLLIIASGTISAADNWIASLLLPSIADTFGVQVSAALTVLTAYLIPLAYFSRFTDILAIATAEVKF